MIAALAGLLLAAVPQPAVPCSERTATRATITQIGTNLPEWVGRCVTLEGPLSATTLYDSVQGLYLSNRIAADGHYKKEARRRHQIGLYVREDTLRSLLLDGRGLPHLRVTGTVDSCERIYDRAMAKAGKLKLVFIGGYCHYTDGAVIHAVDWKLDTDRRYARLTTPEARREFGDLVEAPADWPGLPEVRRQADAFRRAIVARDRDALAALHDISPTPDTWPLMEMLSRLTDPVPPFAIDAEPAIFIRRYDVSRPFDRPYATICFRRAVGTEDIWPISANDADNAASRPYFCTHTVWGRDGGVKLDTPISRGRWLAEPARDR